MKFKKLDWYIAKKFLETFFVTVMLFIIIIMVFDVAEKLDDFWKSRRRWVRFLPSTTSILFPHYSIHSRRFSFLFRCSI